MGNNEHNQHGLCAYNSSVKDRKMIRRLERYGWRNQVLLFDWVKSGWWLLACLSQGTKVITKIDYQQHRDSHWQGYLLSGKWVAIYIIVDDSAKQLFVVFMHFIGLGDASKFEVPGNPLMCNHTLYAGRLVEYSSLDAASLKYIGVNIPFDIK